MTPAFAPPKVLLVSAEPQAADALRGPLESASFPCRVTLSTAVREAGPASAWHDVVVLAHATPDAARELRAGMRLRAASVPLLVVTPPASHDWSELADAVLEQDPEGRWRGALPQLVNRLAGRAEERVARQDAQEVLLRQKALFDGFMRHSPAVAYLKDQEGRYAWVNASFERFFDLSEDEWRGRTDADIWGEEAGARLRENDLAVLQAGEPLEVEEAVPMDDGVHHWLAYKFPWRDEEGRPQVGGMAVDITPVKRAEEERRHVAARLEQARRLESLGGLASGIAHDFNNMLVSIIGHAQLAVSEVAEDSQAAYFLEQVERSALRAADLTHHLLAATGRASLLVETVAPDRFVEARAFALRSALPRRVKLHLDLQPGLPEILADGAQLEQILTTLLARSAASIADAGNVTLRASEASLDVDDLAGFLLGETVDPGRFVLLDVEDDGEVPEMDDLSRVLEPEFQPSPASGAPEGMAAVLGLVRGHRGAARVDALGERGVRVRLALPVATREEPPEDAVPSAAMQGGTVLVVDDEETVRSVARAALQRFGWNVLMARDGDEALRIFNELGDQVSVVLLDATMPGMSGLDVLRRMKEINHGVRVILSSGYAEEDLSSQGDTDLADAFLAKPYRPSRLLALVREVVGEPGGFE